MKGSLRRLAGFALVLAVAALSSACTQSPVRIGGSVDELAPEKSGRILGSIGRVAGRTSLSQFAFKFRPKGTRDGRTGSEITFLQQKGMPFGTELDFNGSSGAGTVFVAHLPPGEYEIYNVRFFENMGAITRTHFSRVDFSIPFSVKEGETIYLGEFLANTVMGKNFIGMPVAEDAYFQVSNKLERDLQLLATKKQIVVASGAVRMAMPTKSDNPFVQVKD